MWRLMRVSWMVHLNLRLVQTQGLLRRLFPQQYAVNGPGGNFAERRPAEPHMPALVHSVRAVKCK